MNHEGKESKVQNLKQILHYQAGSVVSKMLLKRSVGNVTLFAFDGDEGLSEHTAPFDALVIGVEGRAEIPIAGVKHILAEGDSLIMPANVPHAVNPLGQFKMLLVMIRGEAK